MASPWVLLHRMVDFADGRAAATGEGSTGGAGKKAALPIGDRDPSSAARIAGEAMAAGMRPDVVVVKPPEVSRLVLEISSTDQFLDHVVQEVHSGRIVCTHRGLIVLYTGTYAPGGGYSIYGGYLVYDATCKSLSTIPPLPRSIPNPAASGSPDTIQCLGLASAAILRCSNGPDYLVAELVTTWSNELPDAELFLWWSSSTINPAREWTRRPVRLPLPSELTGPRYLFTIDMVFLVGASLVCWVDLLAGILVCDLTAPHEPGFRFVPLPEGSEMHAADGHRPRPEEFRSMACVGSAITFVDLIGYTQGRPANEVAMKTWTLSPDFKQWNEGSVVLVGDLWATESFKQMQLPRVWPMCPVLSLDEEGVICVYLNDMERVNQIGEFGDIVGSYPKINAHYVVLVDLPQNKVLFSTKTEPCELLMPYLMPYLLASDFSSHLHQPVSKHPPTATTTATKVRTGFI